MMVVTLLIAIGLAGLHAATGVWASALFTLTIFLLAASTLAAVAIQGKLRHAFSGFSIFGWIYLLTAFYLWPGPNGSYAPPYLSKALLDAVQPVASPPASMTVDLSSGGEKFFEDPPKVPTSIQPGVTGMAPFTGRVINLYHYRRIGHTLAALAFGLLGGLMGGVFSRLNEAGGVRPSRPPVGGEGS
ncbi:hypothetical protein [Singulisphaera sp. PoT]|uniref:hypothetical protein n=1 Tax=Singulisphaera sp. PoT TaxID=3411797 RepID=UPI003BF51ECA